VYGVGLYPAITAIPKPRYSIACSFACDPVKTDELIDATLEGINTVKRDGCDTTDLGKVKETLLKERELELQKNEFWLHYVSSTVMYNETLKDLDVYNDWVKALKPEKFSELAKTFFVEEELKRFVLYPEETKK